MLKKKFWLKAYVLYCRSWSRSRCLFERKKNPEPVTNGPALQNCCYIKSSYVLENFPYLTRVLIHVFHLIKVNI